MRMRAIRASSGRRQLGEQRLDTTDDVDLVVTEVVHERLEGLAEESQILVRQLDCVHLDSLSLDYIRKTPKVVSGIGALSAAARPSASTRRVSSGSMMPSSQSRAVE